MAKIVYMLHDEDGHLAGGPYLGDAGLDFATLIAEFREHRYTQAEVAQEDYCYINDSDFIEWLLKKDVLSPMNSVQRISIEMDTSGKNRYVPKHWHLCPECGVGRGSDTSGDIKQALNRWTWFFTCTECEHTWGAYDLPYDSKKPMIEDDGRLTPSGCVPYSISQVSGFPMAKVMEVCGKHGWGEDSGINENDGILAARELGLHLVPGRFQMVAGKLTLRRLLNSLSPSTNYIVATRGHWLAVVKGRNVDQADTSMRTEVIGYWEVRAGSERLASTE